MLNNLDILISEIARILITHLLGVSPKAGRFTPFQLPEVEAKDRPDDPLRFDLVQKNPPQTISLAAHKEHVKNNWLKEIQLNASDVGKFEHRFSYINDRVKPTIILLLKHQRNLTF